jgi:hypothetical protein
MNEAKEYRQQFAPLQGKNQARLREFADRWRTVRTEWANSGLHSDEVELENSDLVKYANQVLFEYGDLEKERGSTQEEMTRLMAESRRWDIDKKLELLVKLSEFSRQNLEVGIPLRVDVLNRYDYAISKLEVFVRVNSAI